jgi:hypothetical protein
VLAVVPDSAAWLVTQTGGCCSTLLDGGTGKTGRVDVSNDLLTTATLQQAEPQPATARASAIPLEMHEER